ncbi:MAG: aminotransferase class V-fold PLP-dependent enzyme [Candidatus Taylorbacteria bacterium]|nr:aminotransferase class V-fold PLP-dependent enzyme [Candidatus Taylorbacteria bacterium]
MAKIVRQERAVRGSTEVGPQNGFVRGQTSENIPRSDLGNEISPLFFHCDASQAVHIEINVEQLGVDLLTLDSSKFYGPRGIGMLYIKKDTAIKTIIFGGGQEGGMRSGTENIPAIMGFAKALDICGEEREREFKRLTDLRQLLIDGLKSPADIASSYLAKSPYQLQPTINGDDAKVSPHIINISIPGIDNEFFTLWLDARGISCSTRSACLHDGDESYVLKAMKADSGSSVRFSIGRWTKKGDVTKLCKLVSSFLLYRSSYNAAGHSHDRHFSWNNSN